MIQNNATEDLYIGNMGQIFRFVQPITFFFLFRWQDLFQTVLDGIRLPTRRLQTMLRKASNNLKAPSQKFSQTLNSLQSQNWIMQNWIMHICHWTNYLQQVREICIIFCSSWVLTDTNHDKPSKNRLTELRMVRMTCVIECGCPICVWSLTISYSASPPHKRYQSHRS